MTPLFDLDSEAVRRTHEQLLHLEKIKNQAFRVLGSAPPFSTTRGIPWRPQLGRAYDSTKVAQLDYGSGG